MFQSYFKIAWRYLVRNRIYTTINILGLALGISACLVIYLVSSFELSYDTFQSKKDRVFRVTQDRYDRGKLSTQELADVVAYLLSLKGI